MFVCTKLLRNYGIFVTTAQLCTKTVHTFLFLVFEHQLLTRFPFALPPDPSDERKVIVKRLALCVDDRPDLELDLTSDLSQLKKQVSKWERGLSFA